ncbi:DUF421 domain-containing protein [Flavobacterium selenitireducens]|uniref:DUF421 domain-containing protein n=1 Tax=Flavobacterium selenitireducens TaxID=2722704 RepID=UPI00168AF2B2|nr:YetF domain-containing protein [Flavobacterium selenitireducens]MBD3581259.1 DUF421 domain-containing protein [Flavobacterium selenitireducens]
MMISDWLLDDWDTVHHTAACTAIAFVSLFLFIRISGKRTLSKLNAFDFVVSVSMGSTLSSMILGKVTLAEGSTALIVIIALQFTLAWMATRSSKLEKVINSEPSLLYYEGRFLRETMEREYITESEIIAEIRKYRINRIDRVKAVVLELNGEMTVVRKSDGPGPTSTDEFFRTDKP